MIDAELLDTPCRHGDSRITCVPCLNDEIEATVLLAGLEDEGEGCPRRRTEAEARRCSQPDCPGDGRYQPPGRGHLLGCRHDAVTWVWETVIPPAVTDGGDA